MTGNGGTGTTTGSRTGNHQSTDFASTRYLTGEVESLTDATLTARPSTPPWTTGRLVTASTVADVALTGQLAVVSVTPDGSDNARYTTQDGRAPSRQPSDSPA